MKPTLIILTALLSVLQAAQLSASLDTTPPATNPAVPRAARSSSTIGTPPQPLATPRNYHWNQKRRDY
jgi:hypothetical protein